MSAAPESLEIDLNELTIEEVELLEDILDAPFDQAFAANAKRGKAMRALAFIAMRRIDPDVTVEDVGKVRISALPQRKGNPPVPSAA